jgi:hypothetical protein
VAVFPDRIVLKNSTDDEAAIVAAIESGGTDEITQGEAVLGLLEGEAVIYTKDSLGNIVTINGNAQTLDRVGDVVYPQVAPGWDKKQGFFWNCNSEPEGTYNAVTFEGIDRINLHNEDKDGNSLNDWFNTWTTSDIYSVFLDGVQVGSSSDLTYLDYAESNCRISVAFTDTTIWSAVDNTSAGSILQVQNNSRPFTVRGEPADGSILVYNSATGMWETQPNTGGGGSGGLVFWGGGDFTTGDSDGEAPDGGEFTV